MDRAKVHGQISKPAAHELSHPAKPPTEAAFSFLRRPCEDAKDRDHDLVDGHSGF